LKEIQIHNDELNASAEEFQELEKLLGTELPKEYKAFLHKHNGCTVCPNVPTVKADTNMMVWAIERFLSVGDLILQLKTKLMYSDKEYIKEYDANKYQIDVDKLLAIAIAERGSYYIYFGEEEKGQIYSTCYSDGDGLVKFYTKSFSEFVNTMGFYDYGDGEEEQECHLDHLKKSTKVFDYFLFDTSENEELGFKRFKEVLKLYGDPNISKGEYYNNVPQTYVHNHKFLKYIISQGGDPEGLLNFANNFETIQFLIKEYKLDINKPYNGIYPIHNYTSAMSMHDHKVSYELMDKLLKSDIKIDLTVVDNEGVDLKTKLIKIDKGYKEYMEYDKKNGYFNPDEWIRSVEIDQIIKGGKNNWIKKILGK
jgi:hypothetical protein